MLIDGGRRPDPPPDPEPEPTRRRERADVPWRALGWSAVVVALFVAGLLTAGWPSVGLVYAALIVTCWRGSRPILPRVGTMRDHVQ
jgi:hypothetical protein